jgi:hypothetical protein
LFSSEITIYEASLASITVLVIKMSGRLVGQKNLRSMRKINQRDDMENVIVSAMASATASVASGEGNLLDEDRVVQEVDYFRGGDLRLCYWASP